MRTADEEGVTYAWQAAPVLQQRQHPHQDAAYHRAAWGNVSSFRADVFVLLIAYALGECSRDEMQAHIDAVMEFPEAREFPNKALIKLDAG